MNLVIDVGNTRTKVGLFSGDKLVKQVAYPQLSAGSILSEFDIGTVTQCIFSSVSDKYISVIDEIKREFGMVVFDETTALPFKNNYKTPETLGNDRKANIAGAMKLFPGKNVLVLDAGTCLKTDFVSSKGEYTGGSISPGLEMRFRSLKDYTARLPLVSFEEIRELAGDSTKKSILSGVFNGMLMEMNGFIEQYQSEYSPLQVILTGGDAFVFDKNLKNSIFTAPHLVLIGLNEILNYVKENKV